MYNVATDTTAVFSPDTDTTFPWSDCAARTGMNAAAVRAGADAGRPQDMPVPKKAEFL